MNGLADSPLRNLGWVVGFVMAVWWPCRPWPTCTPAGASATPSTWSCSRSNTVGYREVRPIDTR
ncbi:MAG: hypothetical protein WDN45_06330 [Caulobacteraceae bacterium]